MNTKVLCVDDDANILTGIQRNLRKRFTIETALGGLEALKRVERDGPFAVIVADMQMPGINGVELLNIVRQKHPDTVRVMLTGNADQHTAVDAVNRGHIFQFLSKPCTPDALATTLDNAIEQFRLINAQRELLEDTLNGSVKVLLDMLSLMDPDSFGRSQALCRLAREVAGAMDVVFNWEFELAAMLCQIGCVSVPPTVHLKARSGLSLSGPEKDILLRVPQVGSDLLTNIPRLQSAARIVLYQDKHFDGTGFPCDSVKGEEIPLPARILKVLIDLMQLEARKTPRFKALEQLKEHEGKYDPAVLEAVCRCFHLNAPTAAPELKPVAIQLSALRAGHQLLADVRTNDDMLIAPSGTTVSPLLLERLRNFASTGGLKEPLYIAG